MQTTTENKTNRPFKNPAVEARRRLRETIPIYKEMGCILHPFILKKHPKNPKKKLCIALTEDGQEGSPRIVLNSIDDMPPTTNAVLARSVKHVFLDFDKQPPAFKDTFPQPFMKVKSGYGEHQYFHRGEDIKQSYNLSFGECQYNGRGVFIPGSFHPPSGKFYEFLPCTASKDKIFYSHIKSFRVSEGESEYGPGKNNKANAKEGWIAGIKQDPVKSADNIIQLIKKNEKNPGFELRKHLDRPPDRLSEVYYCKHTP